MYGDERSYVQAPGTETAVKNKLKVIERPLARRIPDKALLFHN
jgi:hypothetical protein